MEFILYFPPDGLIYFYFAGPETGCDLADYLDT